MSPSDWTAIIIALIAAVGGIGAFVVSWQSRREQRRLIAAQASHEEAKRDSVNAGTIASLQVQINRLEADARDRMEEVAMLYETLMSAIARNRTLEAEAARLVRFLRERYPDVLKAYRNEYGDDDSDGAD